MSHDSKRRKVSEERAVPIEGEEAPAVQETPQDAPSAAANAENIKHRRQLFVWSLAPETTTDDLVDLFSQSFPIKHAVAVLDSSSKQCKGYGFVTFADAEDAKNARDELQNTVLHGKKIKLDIAEPRHRENQAADTPKPKKFGPKQKPWAPSGDNANLQSNTLILRNLPWSIKTTEKLSSLFMSYGKVIRASLPTKGNSRQLRGFGIVVLRNHDQAAKALEGLNGKEIDGRTIAVDWSVDKETYQKMQETVQADTAEAEPKSESNGAGDDAGSDDNKDGHIVEDDDLSSGDEESDEDNSAEDEDDEMDSETDEPKQNLDREQSTLFIRNLPFQADDETLMEHFEAFGPVRYARIVIDHTTGMPKGTGFVCFVRAEDAENCLKGAPKETNPANAKASKAAAGLNATFSVLQNTDVDPTGQYTMEGRVLQVSKAVNKNEAERLREEGVAHRFSRDKDKRRLYLLHEGTVASNSPLYKHLSPADISMREASIKQRKTLLEKNPSLHLSLTRLSVRNIPRSVTSKDLKALARSAVVGFATDVKEGRRQPLSKEELARGGEEMKLAEQERRRKGKGVVKQAKIVFENEQGGKVSEHTGAGRSRGYGFIEYYSHRAALMGLRWLNGHEIDYVATETQGKSSKVKEVQKERKKRLIVEFAIENAQVVQRRKEREAKHKGGQADGSADDKKDGVEISEMDNIFGRASQGRGRGGQKRKRDHDSHDGRRDRSGPRRGDGDRRRSFGRPDSSNDRGQSDSRGRGRGRGGSRGGSRGAGRGRGRGASRGGPRRQSTGRA